MEGDEEAHHPLGPSTLKNVEICPGYRSSGESSIFAEEGSMLHEKVENGDLEDLDDEQMHAVCLCLNYGDAIIKNNPHVDVLKEEKIKILLTKDEADKVEGFEYIFGSADLTILDQTKKHIDLIDYKFGRNGVDDAKENIQGWAYMLGMMDKFEWAETCTIHFILPRRDEVSHHTFKRKEMEDIRMRIRLVVERACAETPTLNPRTEVCKFCKFRLSCSALSKKLLPIASKHEGSNFHLSLQAKNSPAEVTDPTELGRMLEIAPVMERWAQAAKKQAAKIAQETGDEIPGHTLRYRSASRKIADAQECYDVMSDKLSPEEFMEACSITIPALTKVYKDKLPKGSKKNARPEIELLLIQNYLIPEEEEKTAFLVKKS